MIQRRANRSAAAPVVPLPQKKSATRSPLFVVEVIIRSSSASGFCVSYPSLSSACELIGGISLQTEPTVAPRRYDFFWGIPSSPRTYSFLCSSMYSCEGQCRPEGGAIVLPKNAREGPWPFPEASLSRYLPSLSSYLYFTPRYSSPCSMSGLTKVNFSPLENW